MTTVLAAAPRAIETPRAEVLRRLESICQGRDLASLGSRLDSLAGLVAADMVSLESELTLPRGERHVERASAHLIAQGGKRLRPMCVSLAARAGGGFNPAALELAVAVELVHAATLLHDDVVDLGDTRRGAPSPRAIYGNAISIFAGDWLLVEALRRVRGARVAGTLERLLDVIEEMIFAESLQLEARGRLDAGIGTWQRVVEGKTAALFRWAMFAGARAGGLEGAQVSALERFGLHLGIAFQAIDDLLDVSGDPRATGKALFADLREGKATYPLLLAIDRDPRTEPLVRAVIHEDADADEIERVFPELVAILHQTRALDECRELAEREAAAAVDALSALPPSPAVSALTTVAEATVARRA